MEYGLMGLSFGEVVKRRRLELGLSQEEFGSRFGRDATRISKVETGHTFRRLPDADEFREWAAALEWPPEVVLARMGYIGEQNVARLLEQPELVFTSLADEVRDANWMSPDVQEAALDGLKHAKRMWEREQNARSR
jgi:transcriptional regulator with XRE-family HTH domain